MHRQAVAAGGGGHPSITEEVREAIFAVRAETRNRSRMGMKAKYVLVAQYVAENFGTQVQVPCYWTLRAGLAGVVRAGRDPSAL